MLPGTTRGQGGKNSMKEPTVAKPDYKTSFIAFATLQRATAGLFLLVAFLWAPDHARAAGCAAAPPGLISWWRGENNATDVVGANQGTLLGGTTYVTGEVGQAFSFNGIN